MTRFDRVSGIILNKLKDELPGHLFYHNVDHTIGVLEAAGKIADLEGIDPADKQLLLTAALFHDTGFINGRKGHEEDSCAIAGELLGGYNYGPAEIDKICGMIRATKIPQSPKSRLEEILCDADLDYLGRDDFFVLSNKLFLELCAEDNCMDDDKWNRHQADFMESHHYFTGTALSLRQAKKEYHINLVKSKIK